MRQAFILLLSALLLGGGWWRPPTLHAAPLTQSAPHTVRVEVTAPTRVVVRSNGQVVFDGTLGAGEWFEWTSSAISVSVNNGATARLFVDGASRGLLGGPGEGVTWTLGTVAAPPAPPPAPAPAPTDVPAPAPEPPAPAEPEAGPREPGYYVVESGDTLLGIALEVGVEAEKLMEVNQLDDPSVIQAGQVLVVPGSDGALPDPASAPQPTDIAAATDPTAVERGSLTARMTTTARHAARNSPYYRTTWVTYYGRPNIAIMGILGEYSIDELVPKLKEQAVAYDEANGPTLGVMPAFHLVYGMATKAPGEDGDHLEFMRDEAVLDYIERAQEEGFAVILDIQIGNLEPVDAARIGFPWLQYDNVHLAIDPEFAMSHPDQERPGLPIGFVTAAQVNEVQRAMRAYMKENDIPGRRILIVHQFLDTMIENKETLDSVYKIDLTLTADGWGGPWPKISKYNAFMDREQTKFTGFKLFYRWDEPLLTEREVLGLDNYPEVHRVDITPNLIIYQ